MIRVCVLALALAGCGGGGKKGASEPGTADDPALSNKQVATEPPPPPPPTTPNERTLAAMVDFDKKFCACAAKPCIQKVSDEMAKWSEAMAAEQKEPVKLSEDEMKRATEIGTHIGECMQKVLAQP